MQQSSKKYGQYSKNLIFIKNKHRSKAAKLVFIQIRFGIPIYVWSNPDW
jgi:hypothetical protein